MNFAQIDENNLFITQTNEDTGIPAPVDQFYQPKWDGEEWIEGMRQEQIDSLKQQSAVIKAQHDAINSINTGTVEVDGMVFNASETSRSRMMSAIETAQTKGLNETTWRLYDGSLRTVTLAQIKEAHALTTIALGQAVTGNVG